MGSKAERRGSNLVLARCGLIAKLVFMEGLAVVSAQPIRASDPPLEVAMRRFILVTASFVVALAPAALPAQGTPPAYSWQSDAPQIRVWINGPRAFDYGQPVPVHYMVSSDAYVIIGRVDGSGRLTILQPTTRTGRTFVHGGIENVVLGRRMPASSLGAFYAGNAGALGGGFVFALASWQPFDMSALENRDFDNLGVESRFTLASRAYASDPGQYVERLAAWVTWDATTPYDYDIDYYATSVSTFASASSMCFSGWASRSLWSDWDMNPYAGGCASYLNSLALMYGYSVFTYSPFCGGWACRGPVVIAGSTPLAPPGGESGSTQKVNLGVIRSGLWAPDTVGVVAEEPDGPPAQQQASKSAKAGVLTPLGTPVTTPRYFAIPDRGVETLKLAGIRPASSPDQRDLTTVLAGAKHGAGNAMGAKGTPPVASREPLQPPARVVPAPAAPPRPAHPLPRYTSSSRRDPFGSPGRASSSRPAQPTTATKPAAQPAHVDVRSSAGSAKKTEKPKKPPE